MNLENNLKSKKGFTLMELLIVIGILAILATAATLVLNPAELLRQSRDSTRIADLSTLNNALSLYVTNVTSPDLDGTTSSCTSLCYVNENLGMPANCGGRHGSKTSTEDNDRTVDGTGWIPVDFTDIPGGSPLAVLPVDPLVATSTPYHFYSYACNNSAITYELNATFESTKYVDTDNYDGRDGGNAPGVYEVGTEPGLDI